VQQINERPIARRPKREPPVRPPAEPALLCYEAEAAPAPRATLDIRTGLAEHRRVALGKLSLVCEPVAKAHEEDQLPPQAPSQLPLGCYAVTGAPASTVVDLVDRNGFFSGRASVGAPALFCDPAQQQRDVTSAALEPYGTPLTGYDLRTEPLPTPATVFVRGQSGVRRIGFRQSAQLLEPSTKNSPGAKVPETSPLHCYRVERGEPADERLVLRDQFGAHRVKLGTPRLFCDPATRTERRSSGSYELGPLDTALTRVALAPAAREPVAAPAGDRAAASDPALETAPTYYRYDRGVVAALERHTPTATITPEELARWDTVIFELVKANRLPPTTASRVFAHVLVAQADAAYLSRAVRGEYSGSVGHLTARVLCVFFAGECPRLLRGQAADGYAEALTGVVLPRVLARVEEETAPRTTAARRAGDGHWRGDDPTTPAAAGWKPWLMARPSQFRAPAPPHHGSAEEMRELARVRTALANVTIEQERAVRFWAGGPGTETPAGIWLRVATDHLRATRAPLELALRVRATLAMTMADAFIACWDTKYAYWTARPFMHDAALRPVIPTPNFPSYTSGHATVSATAAAVLTRFFPDFADRWMMLAEEAKNSRLWSGIHFPVDNEQGFLMGRAIAEYALRRP
jgi:membrane-associated phospholipid phosphatase